MPAHASPDVRLLMQIAARQHNVALTSQMRDCGFGQADIARAVADGWIRKLRLGAVAVGPGRSRWQDAVAALLVAGEGAALSHSTAAAIHRIPHLVAGEVPELIVPAPRHPRLSGVIVHRVVRLEADDVEIRNGMRVTTAARTVVDLAGRMEESLLERVVDEGCVSRLWSFDALGETLERVGGRGRLGSLVLGRVLNPRISEPLVDSGLEQRIVRVLAPFAPFETRYQLVLEGSVVVLDVAWPSCRVGVETDGWWHRSRSRSKFDADRRKMNLLAAHGWTVAHVTSRMSDAVIKDAVARLLPPAYRGSASGRAV